MAAPNDQPAVDPAFRPERLPFRVELCDVSGRPTTRLLALCHSPTLAFTSYYAAMREHLGARVTLHEGERLLAASAPAQP